MKALHLLIIALIFTGWHNLAGQQTTAGRSYTRISLTVIYVDDPNPDPKFNAGIGQSVRSFFDQSRLVGPKYNDHTISTRFARIDLDNFTSENRSMIGSPKETKQILDFVNNSDISRQIISKWFDRQPDGSFRMDLIGQRGLYNASDNDYITAAATQRQFAGLKDQGEKLLKLSYILFVNISDIKYTEIQSLKSGSWSGLARGYLYKLDWNDSISSNFYQNLWISEGDGESVKSAKKQKFETTVFQIVPVKNINVSASKSNASVSGQKPGDGELIAGVISTLYENIIEELDRKVPEFQVMQNLISSNPIGATIGTKEGLYVDQRFFVFENLQKRNQEVIKRRRAVIRAKTVENNEKITEGKTKPSTFYQVAGGKIDHFGMYIQQMSDRGLSVMGTMQYGEMQGVNVTLGYNLSRSLSKSMKLKRIPTGVNFFVDLAIDEAVYGTSAAPIDIPEVFYSDNPESYNFLRASAGLSKDYYFFKNFHFTPRVGYGIEYTALLKNGDSNYPEGLAAMGDHLLAGVSGGMNLLHNFQLVGGFNFYVPVGNLWIMYGADNPKTSSQSWSEIFYGREWLTVFGGVRILL